MRWPASPDTMAANTVEIPFWIFGQQKWVSGINKNTTCQEVGSMCNFTVMSRARNEGPRRFYNYATPIVKSTYI